MLKWLVQKASTDPTLDIITDDPLATLDFGHEKKKNKGGVGGGGGGGSHKEIYSVNR